MGIQQFFRQGLFLFSLYFLLVGQVALGQSADAMSVVEDLSLRLYKLDASQLSFSANLDQEKALGFYLTPADRFELLRICNSDRFSIWKDGQMIRDLSTCFSLSAADLGRSELIDTVYFAMLSEGYFQDLEINLLASNVQEMQLQNVASIRTSPLYKEWSIFMLFIIGGFAAILRVQNVSLFDSLFRVSLGGTRDAEMEAELNVDMLVSVLFVALLTTFNIQLLRLTTSYAEAVTTAGLLYDTFLLTLMGAAFLLLKFFLIAMLAGMNALSAIRGIQFVDFLKFFSVGGVVFFVLLQMWYWYGYSFKIASFWAFDNFYLILYSLFILYFYIKLVQVSAFKKLHIISYLCTTEFIGVFLLALIIYK